MQKHTFYTGLKIFARIVTELISACFALVVGFINLYSISEGNGNIVYTTFVWISAFILARFIILFLWNVWKLIAQTFSEKNNELPAPYIAFRAGKPRFFLWLGNIVQFITEISMLSLALAVAWIFLNESHRYFMDFLAFSMCIFPFARVLIYFFSAWNVKPILTIPK